MQILTGAPALSTFRLEKRISALRERLPDLTGATAHTLYLVLDDGALTPAEAARLAALLDCDGNDALAPATDGVLLLVAPRAGTTSPWSSKATDIAHNCGLSGVSRIERAIAWRLALRPGARPEQAQILAAASLLHDRMTESVVRTGEELGPLLAHTAPARLVTVPVMSRGSAALEAANRTLGLALTGSEIDYLLESYMRLGRDPTDVELMMFAQANSEHCRHKIFNAAWSIDGVPQSESLFAQIRYTHARHPGRVLSAYSDNAAVARGYAASWFGTDPDSHVYRYIDEDVHLVAKVETHNHPTAIAPTPGAATGSGGEIRDEGATGRGARPVAGLTGFSVSNLRLPGALQPWEEDFGRSPRQASALQIMLEAPVGAAAYNNEFGRPALAGYFRTFEARVTGAAGPEFRGYHKPVMLAGGLGAIRPVHVTKGALPPEAILVVLGGPAYLIGLGGGAASSQTAGSSAEALDLASVQRDNAEMQRRCQEVINRCVELGERNPIISIHDVGAGGLSNAVPELLHASGRGGVIDLRAIPSADPGLSPLEIWCNEAQERYVLGIAPEHRALFEALCRRERCPSAVIGRASAEPVLQVHDALQGGHPVDLPMSVLFGQMPRMQRSARRARVTQRPLSFDGITIAGALARVLRLPGVGDKRFLITIGDRTVSGLTVREQMVGPWQMPVADCAVTASSLRDYTGAALAIGERAPLALIDAPAAGRMAVGEALTNLAGARVMTLGDVLLSANWMAACGQGAEDARLFDTVRAVAHELCPALGIPVPVGKDSLSMQTTWQTPDGERTMTAPLTLVVSAFAPVVDVRQSLTPQLLPEEDSELLLIDLGRGRRRLGGSALAQVHGQIGDEAPDLDHPEDVKLFFAAIQVLNEAGLLLAYHDRSDGGLIVTLTEMALAGRTGLRIDLDPLVADDLAALFCEELGTVIQVHSRHVPAVLEQFAPLPDLTAHVHRIGRPQRAHQIDFLRAGQVVESFPLVTLQAAWSETTWRMQSLRDNPQTALEEFEGLLDMEAPGLSCRPTFDPAHDPAAPWIGGVRPRVAILREQGVNGQVEMAAAFDRAGFEAVDVHMTDLITGAVSLDDFQGLAACGGFSYGDVLGAGGGWAGTVLYNARARDAFERYFARPETFTIGVCNGCQMLARLRAIIPGTAHWPRFLRNRSEQFEARLVMVEVVASASVLFTGMAGSRLPIVVAHGEGRADFGAAGVPDHGICLRYVDTRGRVTETYPANPNGSPGGITGLTSDDGRVTLLMPHPERLFLRRQMSWAPPAWTAAAGPWLRLFQNARCHVG